MAEERPRVYVLAVAPSQPAVAMHKAWSPFVEQLSASAGVPIELKLYETFPAFLTDCEQGTPDFIFTPPNLFFLAYQHQRYLPLVRSSVKFCGQIFVRKDAPAQRVKDLQGKTIAFIGPLNVCSVITRHALALGEGAIDYNTMFSGSAVNVAKMVLLGKVDAGAMLDSTLLAGIPEHGEFRVLLQTDPIAPHPLAAHPRVPPAVRAAVTRTVLGMATTDVGGGLLAPVRLIDPVRADFKRDYAHFADGGYERLQHPVDR